jgi:hypothetical protein
VNLDPGAKKTTRFLLQVSPEKEFAPEGWRPVERCLACEAVESKACGELTSLSRDALYNFRPEQRLLNQE